MSTEPLPGPGEWMGDAGPGWPAPAELVAGAPVLACYAIIEIAGSRAVQGGTGADMVLADARGRVGAWLPDPLREEWVRPGFYIGIRGIVEAAALPRIRIEQITPLRVTLDDLFLFLPRAPRNAEAMDADLAQIIASIADDPLRDLVHRLLGIETEVGRGFRLAPAATRNHHAYLGGLLEHTISVARICDSLAAHYGTRVDRDLLIAGALLHDIGKIREIGARAGFPYTTEGKLLGHILLGLRMIGHAARNSTVDAERLMLLEHLVASHQGRYEWQSPREPRVLEALLLHYADDLDAKAQHAIDLIESVEAGWTAWDRTLGREMLRHLPPPEPSEELPEPAPRPARKRKKGRTKSASKKKTAGRKTRQSKTRDAMPRPSNPDSALQARRPNASQGTFMDRDTLDMFET